MTEISVTGLKELQKRLIEIGSVSGTKIMRSAMFAATKPILDKAKANAPERSGALRAALARTFGVAARSASLFSGEGSGSRFSILIGPKVRNRTAVALYNLVYNPKRPRRGIFHGHFTEFGTRTGTQARHWLRSALESSSRAATSLLAEALKKKIEAAAKKR